MAVHRRSYKRYTGELTSERWRFSVLRRYALKTFFESKINTVIFVAAFIPHLIALLLIYFMSNVDALSAVGIPLSSALEIFSVNGYFFSTLFVIQTFISFFLVSLVGPGLVSPDLANNALPLYFSRPFSRLEYVLGKLSIMLTLTSLVTWIPGLILVAVQASMAGFSWLSDNMRIVNAIFVGSWIWILTISLISLAVSAWVKWKPLAAVSLFGMFFVAAGFGTAANTLLDTRWGTLLNMGTAMNMVWRWMLLGESQVQLLPGEGTGTLPAWTGLLSMLFVSALAVFMLAKKVRAASAVR